MWFDVGRSDGYPTHYSNQHSPAKTDVLTSGIILAFLIVAVSFATVLPAYSFKRAIVLIFHVTVSLFIGLSIVVGSYGHQWEHGNVDITSQYKSGSSMEMKGNLGLDVALRGVNITLKGDIHKHKLIIEIDNSSVPEPDSTNSDKETIDYNEHFSWEWAQGRFGFGPYAGRFSREFREGILRGLPIPILQLAEYFTFDGEGIRFGRHYRLAGWHTHLFLWCAFLTWIVSNCLFCFAVNKAAIALVCTGLLQFVGIVIWSCLRNPIELTVPFESIDGSEEVFLSTKYGSTYILVASNACLCTILGLAFVGLHLFYPEELCGLFGIDPLTLYEEKISSEAEDTGQSTGMDTDMEKLVSTGSNGHQMVTMSRKTYPESNLLRTGSFVRRKRKSLYFGNRNVN